MKIKKNGGSGGRGVRLGGQGGGEGSGWGGGQGGCVRRIEVFGKIHQNKISGEGSGWGVRVDVNEELKFL